MVYCVFQHARDRAVVFWRDEKQSVRRGNLDRASSDEVFVLMRRMHAELNTSFLIVTHDPRLAARCDRVIELVDGRIQRDELIKAAAPN